MMETSSVATPTQETVPAFKQTELWKNCLRVRWGIDLTPDEYYRLRNLELWWNLNPAVDTIPESLALAWERLKEQWSQNPSRHHRTLRGLWRSWLHMLEQTTWAAAKAS
jgi:hypothetical protein